MTEFSPPLDRLADLTRRYAAWGREEGGIPLAWGGLTLAFLLGLPLGLFYLSRLLQCTHPSPMSASSAAQLGWKGWEYFLLQINPLVIAALPLSWVLAKDGLRERLYQSHGRVEPEASPASIWIQRISRILMVLAAVCFPILAVLDNGGELTKRLTPFELILGLTGCWALPWLGWTRVKGWLENLIWTPMALLSLLMLFGGYFSRNIFLGVPMGVVVLYTFFVAPAAIILGLVQHVRFLRLQRELRMLEQA